jgi:hypothetical protein
MPLMISYEHPSTLTEKNITQITTGLKLELRHLSKKLWPKVDRNNLNRKIANLARSKTIKSDLIFSCWETEEKPQNKTEKTIAENKILKIEYAYAYMCSHLAIKAKDEEKINLASTLTTEATHHLGILHGHYECITEARLRSEKAAKGGTEKSLKINKIRDFLIELLKTPPNKGWEDKDNTARLLTEPLDKYILENTFGKLVGDTEVFIHNEIKKKGVPKNTYLSYMKK